MTTTDAQKIIDLRKELTEHSYLYYVQNSPELSDAQYDAKFKELIALEKEHPEMGDPNSPTLRVGSPIPTGLRTIDHQVRMLSLDNVNSLDETMAFFNGLDEEDVTIEMKIDGLSLHLDYKEGQLVQAITRGDGTKGQDVTENARTIRTVPLTLRKPVTVSVRGEAYWRISSLQAYNAPLPEDDQISNPRNGASGSLQLKDSKAVAKRCLDFVAYSVPSGLPAQVESQEALLEYLEFLGFPTTMILPLKKTADGEPIDMPGLPYLTCSLDRESLAVAIDSLDKYRKVLDLETDGLVLKLSSLALHDRLGEGTRFPKWAAAYKFPPETKETQFTGVIIQVGKSGQITPVAELEPVNLGGAMVRRASLCNQDELDRLGIDIGDFVNVQRSGEVIPKVTGLARPSASKSNVNKSYQIPKRCPCCSTELIKQAGMVHLYCPNPECEDQVYARLVYATGKDALDIDGCGEVTIQQAMRKRGVKKLSDLYAITDFSFLKPVAARKLKEGLEKAKDAPFWRKLMALSVDEVGQVKCQILASKFEAVVTLIKKPDEVKAAIGDSAATSLLTYLDAHMDELYLLSDFGFFFEDPPKAAGPLTNMVFCITGTLMSGRRNDVAALIAKNGGTVKNSVTKDVNYLIQGEGGGARKAGAVAKFGTTIINELELYRMMGIPMPVVTPNLEP